MVVVILPSWNHTTFAHFRDPIHGFSLIFRLFPSHGTLEIGYRPKSVLLLGWWVVVYLQLYTVVIHETARIINVIFEGYGLLQPITFLMHGHKLQSTRPKSTHIVVDITANEVTPFLEHLANWYRLDDWLEIHVVIFLRRALLTRFLVFFLFLFLQQAYVVIYPFKHILFSCLLNPHPFDSNAFLLGIQCESEWDQYHWWYGSDHYATETNEQHNVFVSDFFRLGLLDIQVRHFDWKRPQVIHAYSYQ